MSGVLTEIKILFGDKKSFYDILNIKKEATKDEVKYCSLAVRWQDGQMRGAGKVVGCKVRGLPCGAKLG